MKQAIVAILALIGAAALVVGGVLIWNNRPGRTAVSVNGRILTDRELTWRAQTLIDDAKRVENLLIPEREMSEAMRHYRRMAARMWIMKEVLLSAAVESGVKATAEDEKRSLEKVEQQLKSRHLTPEQFFKEGPVPEDTKRADFRETVLIGKFTKKAIEGKLGLANKEIDDRVKELMTLHENAEKQGRKLKFRADRKTAIEMLRQEKYTSELQNLVREHFVKMSVECPAFPDLESVDVIFPPR